MKTILAICASLLLAAGFAVWKATRWPDQFGAFTGAAHTNISTVIDAPASFIGKTIALQGTAREQCTAMGCFFYLFDGKRKLRVDMEDIAMKAPRKEGHPVHVEGQIVPYGDGFQLFATAVKFE